MDSARPAEGLHRALGPAATAVLAACRIVLVAPSHAGNVGAVARAMATMGLHDLVLTGAASAPHRSAAEAQARATAAGRPILDASRAVATLVEAVGDCAPVIAVSAETRALGPLPQRPRAAAATLLGELATGRARRIAFVFGSERTGLSVDDMNRCDRLVTIPADPQASSLNLAQAVQIIAYAVREAAADLEAALGPERRQAGPGVPPADHAAVDALCRRAEAALVAIGALDPAAPGRMMPRLRRLFARNGLDDAEVRLLHGILNRIDALAPPRADRTERGIDPP